MVSCTVYDNQLSNVELMDGIDGRLTSMVFV